MNIGRLLSSLATLTLAGAAIAGNGRIIAIGDEWLLSDPAFTDLPGQTNQLTDNISRFFTDGEPSRFLVLSNSPALGFGQRGVLGAAFKDRMLSLGNTWEVNPAVPFTLTTLQNYRGVFLAGTTASGPENAVVLEAYVRSGGNVLVMAGTGDFGSAGGEAASWNYFLTKFGLAFGSEWFAYGGSLLSVPTLPSSNPLGKLITTVQWGNGQTVLDLSSSDPTTEIVVVGDFTGFSPLLASGPIQSIIGTVNITTRCLGDFNNDGIVDDLDFSIFVVAYNLLLCDDPAMGPACPCDLNSDGFVDDIDFTIFVQFYDSPLCLQ